MNIRSKSKKQRILDATMELIAENGLHATPMSQVTKLSGVSAGTIYHYFPSKEAMINQLYLKLKKEIAAAAFQGYDIQKSYKERFLLMWHNSLNYFIANPSQLSFIEQCSLSPVISPAVKAKANETLAPIIGFITEGMASGHLKRMELQLLLSFISSSIVGTAKLQLSDTLEIRDEHKRDAAQACWDGIRAT